jgi:DNA (cytosine-5)-methyltransferase 1
MTHGSLFSGMGGFDLAAQWMGWENIFHCEWNSFGQKILKHYWPNATSYNDITKTDFTIHRGTIGIITGGFPCQPYSVAGKQLGTEDERHLWPEMLRAIREVQPAFVVGENVPGLVNWDGGVVFEQVQTELEAEGYEIIPFILPAAGVNAPHKRERIWFIAYAKHYGQHGTKNRQSDRKGNEYNEARQKPAFKFEGCCHPTAPEFTFNPLRPNDGGYYSRTSEGDGMELEWFKLDTSEWNKGSNHPKSPSTYDADTHYKGLAEPGLKSEQYPSNEGLRIKYGCSKAIPYANGIRLRREGDRIRTAGFIDETVERNDWTDFPTQSPICDGDDGLSARLDTITFSKWRNESIKAGGNAIVPEVALKIFKAIEQFQKLCG